MIKKGVQKAILNKNQRTEIVFNLSTVETRREEFQGTMHLVVPAVMMVPGVHNGSQGPLLYEDRDLEAACPSWNGMPITIYHPKGDASARTPEVLNEQGVGIVLNTRYDGGQKTECWFDEDRLKDISPETKTQIDNHEMVEVSTGLFADYETAPKGAVCDGEKYVAVARNHRPDHFAILPGKKGSCSIEDGAGLLRNEKAKTHSENHKRSLIGKALTDRDSYNSWMDDHTDGHVYYTKGNKSYRESYKLDDAGTKAILGKDPEEVFKKLQYTSPEGKILANFDNSTEPEAGAEGADLNETTQNEKKENIVMNKTQLIAALIANAAGLWTESDRKYLEGRDEKWLQTQHAALDQGAPAENAELEVGSGDATEEEGNGTGIGADGKKTKPKKKTSAMAAQAEAGKGKKKPPMDSEDEEEDAPPAKNMSATEYLAKAPAEIREVLSVGLQTHNAQKAVIVKKLVANKRCKFTANELNTKKLPELQKLLGLVGEEEHPVHNFAGLDEVGEPVTNAAPAPLSLPNWGE